MSDKGPGIEHWSRVAAEWTAWARAPNHDEFWAYRAVLRSFIGQGAGDALDVGCGEGRVSRLLKECGYRVTAIDPVEQLICAAEQAGSADVYKIGTAADLPFANRSFDLVVAYNVLMDVEDVPATLKEIGDFGCFDRSPRHRPWSVRWFGTRRSVRHREILFRSGAFRREGGARRAGNAFRRLVTALGKLHGRFGRSGVRSHINARTDPGRGGDSRGQNQAMEQSSALPVA